LGKNKMPKFTISGIDEASGKFYLMSEWGKVGGYPLFFDTAEQLCAAHTWFQTTPGAKLSDYTGFHYRCCTKTGNPVNATGSE
jgi:hypothetical protein